MNMNVIENVEISNVQDTEGEKLTKTNATHPNTTKLTNGTRPTSKHPLDNRIHSSVSLESLDLDLPSLETYKDEIVDFPSCPSQLKKNLQASGIVLSHEHDSGTIGLSDDDDEDHSIFQAVLSPDCQDVRLRRERPKNLPSQQQRRKIRLTQDMLSGKFDDDISNLSDEDLDEILSPSLDSPDELEDSILEQLADSSPVDPIPELSAEEEREEARSWKRCMVAGVERRIDMKVIEPYKRVLSHGGYLTSGSHNAIVVFSACFLPHHSRLDYSYVMDNLFCYVLTTLDQLVTDDYVLVYLHGGTAKDCMPPFSWLKRCYQMIDRKLRKNLKKLYMVHPTFWLKTIVLMTKPFVSSKFSRKIQFINSLSELYDTLPLEQACIPDRVHQYDRIKQSIQQNK